VGWWFTRGLVTEQTNHQHVGAVYIWRELFSLQKFVKRLLDCGVWWFAEESSGRLPDNPAQLRHFEAPPTCVDEPRASPTAMRIKDMTYG
jgi:hypothetical protein